MSKKKILFLIHALNPAGAQKVLVRLANAMDKGKYEITIKTIYNRHDLSDELDNSICLQSIIPYTNPLIVRILGFLLRKVLPPSLVADWLIGTDYNYVVAYLEGEATKLLSGSSLPRNRKIAWVHVDLMKIFTSQALYCSIEEHKKTYNKYGTIVCVSQGVKTSVFQRFALKDNVEVIYNIIDSSKLERLACEQSDNIRKEKAINLLLVGNARKEKAYDRFLRVCKRLKDMEQEFHVTICGNGSEYDNLLQLRDTFKLVDTVSFMGEVKNPYPYMKQADLLVCSSISEGFSTVVVEAILLGCPILTTDCSGMTEILDNGHYGIIVENSEDGLLNGLKKILQNPQILDSYREKLQERKSFFSTEKSLQQIDNLFK